MLVLSSAIGASEVCLFLVMASGDPFAGRGPFSCYLIQFCHVPTWARPMGIVCLLRARMHSAYIAYRHPEGAQFVFVDRSCAISSACKKCCMCFYMWLPPMWYNVLTIFSGFWIQREFAMSSTKSRAPRFHVVWLLWQQQIAKT